MHTAEKYYATYDKIQTTHKFRPIIQDVLDQNNMDDELNTDIMESSHKEGVVKETTQHKVFDNEDKAMLKSILGNWMMHMRTTKGPMVKVNER